MVNHGSTGSGIGGENGYSDRSDDRSPIGIALTGADTAARPALAVLFDLDVRLQALARRTRDPLVAQMRLTWWHDALGKLDAASAPAEPLLRVLAATVLPTGVSGTALARVADGWEILLEQRPLSDDALCRHAVARGATLFAAAGQVLECAPAQLTIAGEAWALADLAASTVGAEREAAERLVRERLDAAMAQRWPRAARPLGVLALLTVGTLTSRGGTAAALRGAWRVFRFRLTGR